MNPRVSRRQVLALGATGLAAVTAGVGWRSTHGPARVPLAATSAGAALTQPAVLDSRAGRLHVDLTVGQGVRLAGLDCQALGYNGTSPGPTIRVRPGDELTLRLTNRLTRATNLHTHGLRVSPSGAGDNPFVHAEPEESLDYRFRIPDDHPTGTFWYHPHQHGATAEQVFGGLAGALLVVPRSDGSAADEPEVDADTLLVVTDTTLLKAGTVAPAEEDEVTLGREGELVLVNGLHRPVLRAAPGELLRWRIVNACASRVFELRLDGHTVHQIAVDGAFLPAPAARERVLLAPGNRADLLVRPAEVGRFDVVAEPVDRGRMGAKRPTADPVVLAVLAVEGPAREAAPLPDDLPAAPPLSASADRTRQIALTMRMSMGGMGFGIDDRAYDPARDDHTVRAGATEDWLIDNEGPLAHPFHLHVWPFVVLATSDGAPPAGVLQDVVFVPARGWARIRVPFTGQTGRSVFHCHVLDHGDRGMMATVVVA